MCDRRRGWLHVRKWPLNAGFALYDTPYSGYDGSCPSGCGLRRRKAVAGQAFFGKWGLQCT